jgi:histone acetyltransferase (RNA polymerase elongator complex component)
LTAPDGFFAREEFHRCRPVRSNKSIVKLGLGDRRVAIFAEPSTCPRGAAIFVAGAVCGTLVPDSAEGTGDMRQVNSFLRSASSRIGRRLKQIVAIAAASLPSAGV